MRTLWKVDLKIFWGAGPQIFEPAFVN